MVEEGWRIKSLKWKDRTVSKPRRIAPEAGKEEDGKIIIIAFVYTLVLERGLNVTCWGSKLWVYVVVHMVLNLEMLVFDTEGPEDL